MGVAVELVGAVFRDAIKIQIFPLSCSVCLCGGESPSWFQGGDKLKLTPSHIDTERKKEEHSSAYVSLQEPEGSPGRDILLFLVGQNWVTGHVTMP